jgi:DNA-binding transcriptional regulator YiaG
MESLGKKIKEKREKDRLSAEDLAIKLQTKKENIYKWEKGAKPSDPHVYARIQNWLEGLDSGTKKLEENAHAPNGMQSKYIKILEEQLEEYKNKVHAILQRMEPNLKYASDNIIVSRAEIRAYGQYTVMKDAKQDVRKYEKIMVEIDKLIGENFSSVRQQVDNRNV